VPLQPRRGEAAVRGEWWHFSHAPGKGSNWGCMSGATSAQKRGGSCQVGVVAFQLGLARWMDIDKRVEGHREPSVQV
jgi:hypothetical protein